jgi:hypothetical protein
MAIYLPIVTSFNDKGLKTAAKGFKDLEGAQAKAKYALFAAAGLGALAAGAVSAVALNGRSTIKSLKRDRRICHSKRQNRTILSLQAHLVLSEKQLDYLTLLASVLPLNRLITQHQKKQ